MTYTAAPQNMQTFWNDTNRHLRIRSVGEKVFLGDVNETIFVRLLGGLDSGRSKFGFRSITDAKVEWLSDGELPITDSLASGVSAPASLGNDDFGNAVYATEDWTVSNVGYFMPGMVLEMPLPASAYVPQTTPGDGTIPAKELVWISSVDSANSQIEVVRGFAGTPVYAYLASHPVCINSTAALERQDWAANYVLRRTSDENYFQIFYAGLGRTKKQEKFADGNNYGGEGSEYDRQMRRIMGGTIAGRPITGVLPMQLEMALVYGKPTIGNEDVGYPAAMGGITSFDIWKPVYPDWTMDRMQTVMQTLFENGSNPDVMVVSPDVKRVISQWAEHRNQTPTREDRGYGVVVDKLMTDFGEIGITMHRKLNKGEIFILNTSEMGLVQGWEFEETMLAQDDSSLYKETMIDGCYSFALGNPLHHAWIRIDNAAFYAMECNPSESWTEPALPDRDVPAVVA